MLRGPETRLDAGIRLFMQAAEECQSAGRPVVLTRCVLRTLVHPERFALRETLGLGPASKRRPPASACFPELCPRRSVLHRGGTCGNCRADVSGGCRRSIVPAPYEAKQPAGTARGGTVPAVGFRGIGHRGGSFWRKDSEPFFLLFLDDDAWRNHHHQALGFAADAHVLEQPVDIRQLVEDGHAELVAALA